MICAAVRLDDEWSPFTHGFDLIGDGSLIAIPLPGHTAAQMGLVVRRAMAVDVFSRRMRAGRVRRCVTRACPRR